MKKLLYMFVLLGAAVTVSCSTGNKAVRSAADEANAKVVAAMLDKGVYKMDFDRAYPTSGPSFSLTYPYYVSVIRDRVESFLPYFGRAYSIPYGGGEGLRFDAPITNYKVEEGKKGKTVITFDARTSEDNYRFRIEIYPTGQTYLTVTGMQKQTISFNGNVDLDPEFELIKVE